MAFGNTGGGDVIASLPRGICLKIGKGCYWLTCSWLLVYRFTTPHLNLKTCTRYPAAETRDPGPERCSMS